MEAAVSEITTIQKKSENELEAKFKEHLQLLVDGQNLFMDNCHRLQSNERQIENDMVLILERILDHIDNKWEDNVIRDLCCVMRAANMIRRRFLLHEI